VSEIKKAARKDSVRGGEGAVIFLEKISPAIEQVDSSSGAIGNAVNRAMAALVPIIARAPATAALRDQWLKRLWRAVEADHIPYIEMLPFHWGDLCADAECASHWADQFIDNVRMEWEPNRPFGRYYPGIGACLSALFAAGRHGEILELLGMAPHKFWEERQWGVKALIAMGKRAEALRFAEDSRGLNQPDGMISEACETILLESGLADEAYDRYAMAANQKNTYLATFRAIVKKYPGKKPGDLLKDLVATTPGNEGKWFAAAKSVGLFDEAIDLARIAPCDPKTLTRAARDMAESRPGFALEAGMAALHWLVEGYGYDITGADVHSAYDHTLKAAEHAGCRPETLDRIRDLVARETFRERFITRILGPALGLK
jgi:hypothetical protein